MAKYQFGEFNREGRLLDHVLVDATGGPVDMATPGYMLVRSDGTSYQLITEDHLSDDSLVGTWEIDVSNIFAINLGNDREVADPKWSDITAGFSPTIVAVTGPSNQPAQAHPLTFRAHRVVFHATAGKGYVSVYNYGKGS